MSDQHGEAEEAEDRYLRAIEEDKLQALFAAVRVRTRARDALREE